MWTQFWDMHSGGGAKERRNGVDISQIFIEAPENEARIIFYNRFGHSPDRVTCTCCGEDYSVSESKSLREATAFQRNCMWDKTKGKDGSYVEHADPERSYGKYIPLEEYVHMPDVLVIRKDEIKPEERQGEVPKQGYVWVD
jgi:hypothetical protein